MILPETGSGQPITEILGEDYGLDVVTDPSNHVYLAGDAVGNTGFAFAGFQNTFGGGASDGFLARFDSLGVRVCATYYGGNGDDYGTSVSLDQTGNIYLGGDAASVSNIASGGFQNTYGGGQFDAFLAKFSPCLNLGLGDHPFHLELTVYPNPSTGVFSLSSEIIFNGNMEIYNSLGEKVFHKTIEGTTNTTIDMRDLSKGFYLIRIMRDNKDYIAYKLLLID